MHASQRFRNPALELWLALGAVLLATIAASALLHQGAARPQPSHIAGFFESVLLGPLLALAGAWLDARRGQALGLLLLAFAVLLSLDGAIASYLWGLPAFVLVLLSFGAAILRRR
jgi:hypothetical protein